MYALKGLGVENQDDLSLCCSNDELSQNLKDQLSPVDYVRFQQAKTKLFSKTG
jgi:hypothetical protein